MISNVSIFKKNDTATGVHVSIPLVVDHARGFSATWNEIVIRPYEGSAVFW
jgi:hypothetical protein